MTFTDAAAEVLRLIGRPLHYKEITDLAIEKNLLSHVGKSPEVTMGARLAATLKKDTDENPLVRVKPGVFALRAWDEKTIRAGLEGKKGGKRPLRADLPASAKGRKKGSDEGEAAGDGEASGEHDDELEVDVSGEGEPEERGGDHLAAADEDGHHAPALHARVPEAVPVLVTKAEASAAAQAAPAARGSEGRASHAPRRDEARAASYEAEPPGPDEAMRAEAAAGAAEMFDEEEDDDQPILGGTDERPAAPGAADQGDGRRRRRRRRRGRANGEAGPPGAGVSAGGGSGGLPSYTATPAFEARPNGGRDRNNEPREARNNEPREARNNEPREPRSNEPREARNGDQREGAEGAYRGPQVIELTGGEGQALDDLAGRDLADAVAVILSTFDRNAGAVSLRQIAETAQRRGRLSGDAQLVQSQVAAAVRADNARRVTTGQRLRFRLAGGRVALTDWLLTSELARFEQEALAAVERYRDASRRAFARKLGELPGHAFVEICVLALERVGVSQLRAVRRPGAPPGESHFSGTLRSALLDEVKVALVIRRDGREVGRERVTELRGSFHHYGPAVAGWILTSGQLLSGAREEASLPGAAPVALFDGLAVARLCEDNDVAVLRARLPIAIPDVDLLEALRAS